MHVFAVFLLTLVSVHTVAPVADQGGHGRGRGTLARWHVGTLGRWHVGTLARWHVGTLARWRVGGVAGWRGGGLAGWHVGTCSAAGALPRPLVEARGPAGSRRRDGQLFKRAQCPEVTGTRTRL